MPTETRDFEEVLLVTRAELENRIGALEADVRTEPMRVNNTIQEAVTSLQEEFEAFKAAIIGDFNILVDKLRSCSRAQDLVDEQGGSLDEFLESFRRY